jgi:hypothetical protein
MKNFYCFLLGHKKENIECPYTKVVYNICVRCKSKHKTVLRFQ